MEENNERETTSVETEESSGREIPRVEKNKNIVSFSVVDIYNVVDINLVHSMEERLQIVRNNTNVFANSIYRVPESIRQVDKETPNVYDPYIISIGPYHRGKPSLKEMEEHKWRFLNDYLSRNQFMSLEYCLKVMTESEEKVRSCYAEIIEVNSNDFVEMLVLDGCFIAEYFLKRSEGGDRLLDGKVWFYSSLVHDTHLLENQIPFFILQWLYDQVKCSHHGSLLDAVLLFSTNESAKLPIRIQRRTIDHMLHLYYSYLTLIPPKSQKPQLLPHSKPSCLLRNLGFMKHKDENPCLVPPLKPSRLLTDKEFMERRHENPHLLPHSNPSRLLRNEELMKHRCENPHLLPHSHSNPSCLLLNLEFMKRKLSLFLKHLLHMFLWSTPSNEEYFTLPRIPSVTQLDEAGVKIVKKDARTFLDIKFSNNVLSIPPLTIYDGTFSRFRNLIALEQCYPECATPFTNYAVFMDALVNTAKDVELLHRKDIILHGLGSHEEVALFFNNLSKNVVCDSQDKYLFDLSKKVKNYYLKPRNIWRAKLKRDYFSNPWSVISFVAAVFLLFLTITQTVISILSYVHDVGK